MKRAMSREYGPAESISIEPMAPPVPGPGEIAVRVEAAGVTTADWRLRAAAFPGASALFGRLLFGLRRPRQPVRGTDFAGHVTAVGSGVTRFDVGDAVVGIRKAGGAHADALVIAETEIVLRRPEGLSAAEAAALPFGALTAHAFLHEVARVSAGQRVLILGASGAVGNYAVQLAVAAGAHVTAVAGAAAQARLREMGAERTIDYTEAPITAEDGGFDLIFDTAGVLRFAQAADLLHPKGVFLPLEFGLGDAPRALWQRLHGGPRLVLHVSTERRSDLEQLLALVARGALRPVIGARLPFAQIVEAYRRVESRHAGGPVVVEMGQPDEEIAPSDQSNGKGRKKGPVAA
ncbi:MAG: NAD(P)-dependent alcohol dehydrogenase [Pseudomonadota bacterium]